jgi:hypothetical protein
VPSFVWQTLLVYSAKRARDVEALGSIVDVFSRGALLLDLHPEDRVLLPDALRASSKNPEAPLLEAFHLCYSQNRYESSRLADVLHMATHSIGPARVARSTVAVRITDQFFTVFFSLFFVLFFFFSFFFFHFCCEWATEFSSTNRSF